MIYTLGYPRSGNTWLWRMLHTATGQTAERTHMPASPFENTVVIRRDVRDVICSMQSYRQIATTEDTIRLVARAFNPDQDLYGPYAEHQAKLDHYPIQTTYEQLIARPAATLHRLIQELGLPYNPDAAAQALHKHSFTEAHKADPHAAPWGRVGRWREILSRTALALCVDEGLEPFFLQDKELWL